MAFDYSYAFSSYLDESFDMKRAGLFAVGGLIGQGPALFELDRKWEKLCKHYDIDYFKASECERGKGEFKKYVKIEDSPTPEEKKVLNAISGQFIRLILAEQVVAHGITVNQSEFYDAIKDPANKAILKDSPYRLAYDLAMVQCAWMMKALQKDLSETSLLGTRIKNPHVSFVCDEHEEHSPLANVAYRELKRSNPEAEQYMASYSYADEKKAPVLQAADAIVYTVRRSSKVEMGLWTGDFPPEFKLLAQEHRMGLIQHAGKTNFENMVKIQKPGLPYVLRDIMEQVFHADIKFKSQNSTETRESWQSI
jgi:hypothetical protein